MQCYSSKIQRCHYMNHTLLSTCEHTCETSSENFYDTNKYKIGETAHKL